MLFLRGVACREADSEDGVHSVETSLGSFFSSQIKEKLLQLTDKRKEMIDKWEDRWEWLRLSKDVPDLCSFPIHTGNREFIYLRCFDVMLSLNDLGSRLRSYFTISC